jgi:hypothetical protein
MVVQIDKQLSICGELLLEPGALLGGQLVGHLSGAIPVNLAHSSRIPDHRYGCSAPSGSDHSDRFCARPEACSRLRRERIPPNLGRSHSAAIDGAGAQYRVLCVSASTAFRRA